MKSMKQMQTHEKTLNETHQKNPGTWEDTPGTWEDTADEKKTRHMGRHGGNMRRHGGNMRRHGSVMGPVLLLFTMKTMPGDLPGETNGSRAHPCPATLVALLDHSFEPLVEPSICNEQLLGNYRTKENQSCERGITNQDLEYFGSWNKRINSDEPRGRSQVFKNFKSNQVLKSHRKSRKQISI